MDVERTFDEHNKDVPDKVKQLPPYVSKEVGIFGGTVRQAMFPTHKTPILPQSK